MQSITQLEINSKISRTLLARGQHKDGAALEKLTPEQRGRIAPLVMQFHRAMDLRDRRDAETMASLVRSLTGPLGAGAEQFADFVRGIVKQEILDSKRS
jgi:hypothetical protein